MTREGVRAEAAAWIARLHGPERSTEVEAGLRRWLAESAEHRRVFERMTQAWEDATIVAVTGHVPHVSLRPVRRLRRRVAVAAAAVFVLAVALVAFHWSRDDAYVTDIGEQRTVRLSDGSRVTLNSGSRVVVQYDEDRRLLQLERGEALFEVTPGPQRPFIVSAGARTVTALGTSFLVRIDAEALSVVLLDGKISVSDKSSSAASPAPVLAPGERVTFAPSASPQLDRPAVDAVTAWRRGEVMLEKSLLADAIAEMNRYDRNRLVIDDPQIAALKISGIYRSGDNAGFARAVARMYRLQTEERDGAIHLTGAAVVH
jgi:transmembrane sensor